MGMHNDSQSIEQLLLNYFTPAEIADLSPIKRRWLATLYQLPTSELLNEHEEEPEHTTYQLSSIIIPKPHGLRSIISRRRKKKLLFHGGSPPDEHGS
jgi:hypothetical protein